MWSIFLFNEIVYFRSSGQMFPRIFGFWGRSVFWGPSAQDLLVHIVATQRTDLYSLASTATEKQDQETDQTGQTINFGQHCLRTVRARGLLTVCAVG